jgi:glucose/mannose-6-phosphate isomerase
VTGVDLDDPGAYAAVDELDALADVEGTAAQWAHARELAGGIRADLEGVTNILVLGMGGSGISGDVVATIAADRLDVPVVVRKGYGLPRWVGPRTLVLAASYSGNTEETLSTVEEVIDRGARLSAVTSGGALAALTEERGLPVVLLPGGRQPRHSLGYLAVPLLTMLGLDDGMDEAIGVLEELGRAWDRHVPTAEHPGKELGGRLGKGGLPVIYGTEGVPALAGLRFACQLNENAKQPGLSAAMPELCHNAIVGWEGPSDLIGRAGLIWLRDPEGEHPRNRRRVELVDDILRERAAWTVELDTRGESLLARLGALLLQVDLVSVYTALARGIDPTPVDSITRLKKELG